jgi:hypothetical protein
VRDTASVPCWLAEYDGEWYFLTLQTDGFARLAHQARFVGQIFLGQSYLLVDHFVGQGGTLANLIGYIGSQGGLVLGRRV